MWDKVQYLWMVMALKNGKKIKVAPKHNWHCIIGFLITAALLNFYFILHYRLFFCKEIYFFECLYFSKYDVECRYIIFGWEYGHQLSTYATF